MRTGNQGPAALTVCIAIAAVSVLSVSPQISPAKEPVAGKIRVVIENIQYKGNDRYSVIVSLENASTRTVLIRPLKEGFFVQKERGWTSVNALDDDKNRDSPDILLAPGGTTGRSASIALPLTMPGLFRTYEGDLSLMFRYTYAVRTADGSGPLFQKADEVYCWIKPGTSDWILREGM